MSKTAKSAQVTVIARVRPLLPGELGQEALHPGGGCTITLQAQREAASSGGHGKEVTKEHKYTFSRVHVNEDNLSVYAQSVLPVLEEMKNGRPCGCFAYGYTGTGKSVTIYGSKHAGEGNALGIAELAAHDLLAYANELGPEYALRVSMCEVAGKDCRDLLDNNAPLKVRIGKDGAVHVRKEDGGEFLTRRTVRTLGDFDELLKSGVASRQVGSSTVHDLSSRSHAVIELEIVTALTVDLEEALRLAQDDHAKMALAKDDGLRKRYDAAFAEGGHAAVEQSGLLKEMEDELGKAHAEGTAAIDLAREALETHLANAVAVMRGRIAFIDMAGNDWEQATDVQTKEARVEHAAINTSLLAVKECLRAVATKGRVPYRNSVLTHLLQRHFTAGSRLLMIATLTSSNDGRLVRQSVNTLNYARLVC